jgi:hypothetical protein
VASQEINAADVVFLSVSFATLEEKLRHFQAKADDLERRLKHLETQKEEERVEASLFHQA